MSGPDLAEEVGNRWPEAKILFMTGYTEVEVQGRLGLGNGVELLQKPFRKAELARMVRMVLDGGTRSAEAISRVQPLRQS